MALRCRVPAKLIISGEHAVVYGQPALSMAINLSTECLLNHHPTDKTHLHLNLVNYNLKQTFSLDQAWFKAHSINQAYQDFLIGSTPLNQVLTTAYDLPLLCCYFFDQVYGIMPGEWNIGLQSNAWRGRGLGSSAAIIVSLLSALFKAHHLDDRQQLLMLAKKIESYQHGQSSGIDPTTIATGGLIRYQLNQPTQLIAAPDLDAWLVDTGEPSASTGECVQHVKTQFANNQACWQAFANCTEQLQQAWLSQNTALFLHHLQTNHRLLIQIGVVPTKVQAFIDQLEQPGLAAKLCGAGSVSGEAAGVLLIVSDPQQFKNPKDHTKDYLTPLCEQWGYRLEKVKLVNKAIQCEQIPAP